MTLPLLLTGKKAFLTTWRPLRKRQVCSRARPRFSEIEFCLDRRNRNFPGRGASTHNYAPTSWTCRSSEGNVHVAALLAGALVRQAVGGPTYMVSEDPAKVFVDTSGGGREIRVMHPANMHGWGAQCIPTTALRHFLWVLGGRHFAGGCVFITWAGTTGERDGGVRALFVG